MEQLKSKQQFNIICPDEIQRYILATESSLNAHFYSKADAIKCLMGSYDKIDVLRFAALKNKSYASAAQDFSEFPLLFEDDKRELAFEPVNELLQIKKEAERLGCFRLDPLLKLSLLQKPIVVVGYDKQIDSDLFFSLENNSVAYNLISVEDAFGAKTEFAEPNAIQEFNFAWEEIYWRLNQLAHDIENERLNIDSIQIICPSSYNNLLNQIGSSLGLRLKISFGNFSQTGLLESYMQHSEFPRETVLNMIDVFAGEGGRISKLAPILRETQSMLDYLEKNGIAVSSELRDEMIKSALKTPLYINAEYRSIEVCNSLNQVTPGKRLYFLGFSDVLFPTAKDNQIIPDAIKPFCTHAVTAVQKNKSTVMKLANDLKLSNAYNFSYAKQDTENDYNLPFFFKNEILNLVKKEAGNSGVFYSHGIPTEKSVVPSDLSFCCSIGSDIFIRQNECLPFAGHLLNLYKDGNPKFSAIDFNTYDPAFDDDRKTAEYFADIGNKLIESKKKTGFSYSAIETYLNNPFDFYCSYLLGLKSPSNLANISGTFLHTAVEERERFNLQENLDQTIQGLNFPLNGMTENEVRFLLVWKYENFKHYVFPELDRNERLSQVHLVQPIEKKEGTEKCDEFQPFGMHIFGDLTLQAKYDAIMTDKDGRKAFIVDYKSINSPIKEKYKSYFDLNKIFVGRGLQLPIYLLTFPLSRKQYKELQAFDPQAQGAFLFAIQNKAFVLNYMNNGNFYGMEMEEEFEPFKLYPSIFNNNTEANVIMNDQRNDKRGQYASLYGIVKKHLMKIIPNFCSTFNITSDDDTKEILPWGFYSLRDSNRMDNLTLAQMAVTQAFISCLQFTLYLKNGRIQDKLKVLNSFYPYYPSDKNDYENYSDVSYQYSKNFNRNLSSKFTGCKDIAEFKGDENRFDDFDSLNILAKLYVMRH